MKKYLSLLFIGAVIRANAHELTPENYAQQFKNYDACFILYDLERHQVISEYNPNNRCNERLSPDSTFKIPLSLMAFDQGIITQNTVFKWNGEKASLPDWNHNQTPATWLKYSVVWVSQLLTPQLGKAKIQQYLADFHYGNQDFTGDIGQHNGLTHAWLSSSLQISAIEQLHFLNALFSGKLALNKEAINNTKQNLYQDTLSDNAAYYGKTGSGWHGRTENKVNHSKLRGGWFVGFIEQSTHHYIFVSNLTDKKPPAMDDQLYGGVVLKPLTLSLLNTYFS